MLILVCHLQLKGCQQLQCLVAEDICLCPLHPAAHQPLRLGVRLPQRRLVVHSGLDVLQVKSPDDHLAGRIVHRFKWDAGRVQDLLPGGLLFQLLQLLRAPLSGQEVALPYKALFLQLASGQLIDCLDHVPFSGFRRQPGQLHRLVDGAGKVPGDGASDQYLDRLLDPVQPFPFDGPFHGTVHMRLLSCQDVCVVVQRRHIGAHLAVVVLPVPQLLQLRVFLLLGHVRAFPDGIIIRPQPFVRVFIADLIGKSPQLLDVVHVVQHLGHIVCIAQKAAHRVHGALLPGPVQEMGVPFLSRPEHIRPPRQLRGQLRHLLRDAQPFKDAHGLAHLLLLHMGRVVLYEADLLIAVGHQHIVDGVVIIAVLLPQLVRRLLHQVPTNIPAEAVCGSPIIQHLKDGRVLPFRQLREKGHLLSLVIEPPDALCLVLLHRVKEQLVHLLPQLPAPGAQVVPLPGVGVQAYSLWRLCLVHPVQHFPVQRVDKDIPVPLSQGFNRFRVIGVPQPVQGGKLLHHGSSPVVLSVPAVDKAVQAVLALRDPLRHALFRSAGPCALLRLPDLLLGDVQPPLCFPGLLHGGHIRNGTFHLQTDLLCGPCAHHVSLFVCYGSAVLRRWPQVLLCPGFLRLSFPLLLEKGQRRFLALVFADGLSRVHQVLLIIRHHGRQRFQLALHHAWQRRSCPLFLLAQGLRPGQARLQRRSDPLFCPLLRCEHWHVHRLDSVSLLCYTEIGSSIAF